MCANKSALSFFSTAIASLVFCAATALADSQYAVSGAAYDIETNKLLYREFYTPLDANREVRVDYARPDGSIFASKTLSYIGDVTQPEFEYNDTRDNERLAARFDTGRLMLAYDQEGYRQEKAIMDTVDLVIDAGYDAFIQREWDRLLAGKKVRFTFTMPYRLTTTRLQIKEVAPERSPLFKSDNPTSWRYFSIEPANRFSAIFSDPIYLAYETEGRYLMRFYGRSNLDSDEGGKWDVRIEYEYW
jgi:hypothetical protein